MYREVNERKRDKRKWTRSFIDDENDMKKYAEKPTNINKLMKNTEDNTQEKKMKKEREKKTATTTTTTTLNE